MLVVLLAHGLLLSALWPRPGIPAAAAPSRAATSMRIVHRSPPAAPPQAPAPAVTALPKVAAALAASTVPRPLAAAQKVEVPSPPSPPAALDSVAAMAGAAELPVYATRLPDAVSLHYRLRRGAAVGAGRLQWHYGDEGYELRLDSAWPGQPALGSASRGLSDAEGIAPLRHAELRRAREQRAVNFQREIARITFSGPQMAYALLPGAQDRLSWMIQLPAIVEADPALAGAGASVTLFIAGTRGDAEAWRFEVLGHEALALPAAAVPLALRLRREPTRPYDARVDVWLDPARQHLPVRVMFTTLPGGPPLEMELAGQEPGLEIGAASPR